MIIVAGEALVDLVPAGPRGSAAPAGHDGLRVHCGGGPFNTARWLARLGQPVDFLGTLSDDALGRRLRGALHEDGVALRLAVSTALPTTLALAQLDDSGSATYRFYTAQTAAPALTADYALSVLPDRLEALHVGSLGLVLHPIAEAVVGAVDAVADRGELVMLDPNIRAPLIADRDRYLDRFWRVLRRATVLKLSVDDLEWLVPDQTPRDAARCLREAGPEVVLLTDGPKGAIVVGATESEDLLVAPPTVRVVDTIGAGDAFNAGFLAHWRHHGWRLDDRDEVAAAARFACGVAARACAHAGAAPADVPDL
jgi:fructokinase